MLNIQSTIGLIFQFVFQYSKSPWFTTCYAPTPCLNLKLVVFQIVVTGSEHSPTHQVFLPVLNPKGKQVSFTFFISTLFLLECSSSEVAYSHPLWKSFYFLLLLLRWSLAACHSSWPQIPKLKCSFCFSHLSAWSHKHR